MTDEESIGEIAAALLCDAEMPGYIVKQIRALYESRRPDTRDGRIAILEALLTHKYYIIKDTALVGLRVLEATSSWQAIERQGHKEESLGAKEMYLRHAYYLRDLERRRG